MDAELYVRPTLALGPSLRDASRPAEADSRPALAKRLALRRRIRTRSLPGAGCTCVGFGSALGLGSLCRHPTFRRIRSLLTHDFAIATVEALPGAVSRHQCRATRAAESPTIQSKPKMYAPNAKSSRAARTAPLASSVRSHCAQLSARDDAMRASF
jgi:hypothetical protein